LSKPLYASTWLLLIAKPKPHEHPKKKRKNKKKDASTAAELSEPKPVHMTAAAARQLLPRVATATAAALVRGPLDSFSSRFRTLEPPLLRPPALFSRYLSETAFDAQALDTRVPATVITGFLGSGKVPPASPSAYPSLLAQCLLIGAGV
jgi:hypothetical protein